MNWEQINTRRREKWKEQICDECGDLFNTSRYDAKYCSPNCRKAASRHRLRKLKAEKIYREKVNDRARFVYFQVISDEPGMKDYMIDLAINLSVQDLEKVLAVIQRMAYGFDINEIE